MPLDELAGDDDAPQFAFALADSIKVLLMLLEHASCAGTW